jgi:hypothetical protein
MMIALLVVIVLIALTVILALTPGLGFFVVIPAIALLGYALVVGATLFTGAHPGSPVRRAKRPELLGPGGPDDPDRR